jgi:hypothetical protein
MEAFCELCEEPLGQAATTELLCGHRFHTLCCLVNFQVAARGRRFEQVTCVTCQQGLLPENEREEAPPTEEDDRQSTGSHESRTEEKRVNTLFDTDPKFRETLKSYVQEYRKAAKPRAAFQAYLAERRRELRMLTQPLLVQLEEIHKQKKNQVLESEEYKEYKTCTKKVLGKYYRLANKYNLDSWTLGILRKRKGFRGLRPSWYFRSSNLSWKIRRSLRIRIRF